MPPAKNRRKRRWAFLAGTGSTLAGGLGLGWIMGMSVTPIVQTVITAVLALAVAVANALIGLRAEAEVQGEDDQDKPKPEPVNPLPFGSLLIGLAAGAALGIWSRTHDVLGPDVNSRIAEWKSTGYPDSVIARRLFERTYPPLTKENAVPKGDPAVGNTTFLYHVPAGGCEVLRQATPDSAQLSTQLRVLGDEYVDRVVSQCNSAECMRALVELLCADTSQRD